MSTSNYADFTSLVATANKPNNYVTLGSYMGNNTIAPKSSLLKLTVAAGSERYFSAAPAFEQRLDNFRIPAPAKTPVVLDNSDMNSSMTMSPAPLNVSADYYSIQNGYKLNPN